MIKIYTNQNIKNQHVILSPLEVQTTKQDWWMIYDNTTKEVVVEPQQCSGYTSSPLTIVVADTKEELDQYIVDNDLNILMYNINIEDQFLNVKNKT
jgi:hypothetical protein